MESKKIKNNFSERIDRLLNKSFSKYNDEIKDLFYVKYSKYFTILHDDHIMQALFSEFLIKFIIKKSGILMNKDNGPLKIGDRIEFLNKEETHLLLDNELLDYEQNILLLDIRIKEIKSK